MYLTKHTDISLRVLMHLAIHPGAKSTVRMTAEKCAVSRNHLVKVVHRLGQNGYINSIQGRGGGISLSRAPDKICVGDVIRVMEKTIHIIDCEGSDCPLTNKCILKKALDEATNAFFSTMDQYTMADLIENKAQVLRLIG